MSTVFDVTGISVDGGATTALIAGVDQVTITDATSIPNVTVSVPDPVDTVTVEVPGIQGPPGLQNVFVSSTDPSAGWGAAQTGFIWIQI